MTRDRARASGYALIQTFAPPEGLLANRLVARLNDIGWTEHPAPTGIRLMLASGSTLPVRRLGPDGLLIGRYEGVLPQGSQPISEYARRLVDQGWGRYLAVWLQRPGVALLRDPSGGLEAQTWEVGPLRIVASDIPCDVAELFPPHLDIEWDQIARTVRSATASTTAVALTGIFSPVPGVLTVLTPDSIRTTPLWRPNDHIPPPHDRSRPDLEGMVGGVRDTIDTLITPHRSVVAEISGGFDSAVVAVSVPPAERLRVTRWMNFYSTEAESDERDYAWAVARAINVNLDARPKPVLSLDEDYLAPLVEGLRPCLQGLDVGYDRAVANAMEGDGASALLTGQGGDAVFFQYGTPALAIDRVLRLGLRGLSPRFLHQTARWTRLSTWTLADIALRDRLGLRQRPDDESDTPEPGGEIHPWLEGLHTTPPAKRGQIRQLVNCQIFWGDCLRARAGELLHPLLTQPMMELGLGISADVLTDGGRDRAMARRAFSGIIPDEIRERRGKGELTTFYGQVVLRSLPYFRTVLLEGELTSRGILDRDETEALLDPDVLIWSGQYNLVFIRVLLELWVQAWRRRIDILRRSKPAS